jgi:hypothetical protein
MGQKYLPTARDQKASLRFQRQQQSKTVKHAKPADLPVKKAKQK